MALPFLHFYLRYAEEVTILIRPIALSTVSFSTIALIIVGLILLTVGIKLQLFLIHSRI